MPSNRCPSCPFGDLCTEEEQCPIQREPSIGTLSAEELSQFCKTKHLKITEPRTPSEIFGEI
jgi:hypothetical protein